MGEYAEQEINKQMFGEERKLKRKNRRNSFYLRTPAERKIASIRKEIAIDVKENGIPIHEARRKANIKYGDGWRERGLVVNSDNQWSEEELKDI